MATNSYIQHDGNYIAYGKRTIPNQPVGGGSGSKLLATAEFEVNTTSTSEISVGTITAPSEVYTSDKIVVIEIRRKEGYADGYFYGGYDLALNPYPKNESTNSFSTLAYQIIKISDTGFNSVFATSYGVYAKNIKQNGEIDIKARYSSANSGTIDGTFVIKVYLIDFPGESLLKEVII